MRQILHVEVKGPIAAGKTTFLRVLAEMLREHNYDVEQTQEHEIAVSWQWTEEPPK